MTSFFDDLEAQLRTAARARAGTSAAAGNARLGRRRPRRWVRAGLGAAPALAAILVTLVVVGAALVLLGNRGHGGASGSPPPGGNIGALIAHTPQRQLHRELAYIAAAARDVDQSKACQPGQPAGGPYAQGSPGSDLLSILGVLRRPATPADRLSPRVLVGTPDVYRAYIRRALSVGGVSYYIVPARFAPSPQSNRCFELEAAALDRRLATIPASLRPPTRELQAAISVWFRDAAAKAPRVMICFVSVGGSDTGAQCGDSARGIEDGETGQDNNGTYSGVVPDGVKSVMLSFPAAGGHPARSVTTPVTGNVYAVHVGGSSTLAYRLAYLHPPTVIWRSARGRVLKRIAPPTAEIRAAECKRYPVACLLAAGAYVSSSSRSVAHSTSVRVR
jgi:hypothetical protein